MPFLKKQSTIESFAVIREEQISPTESIGHVAQLPRFEIEDLVTSCMQGKLSEKEKNVSMETIYEIVGKTEETLRSEFQQILKKETDSMKRKFEQILLNEEVRTSFMMCEAHRERQEKICALQTQLECKNLAGLMYVLCLERKKSKVEKMKIIQDYTNYIANLQNILKESQEVILKLSRGFKSAARVDHEWRVKVEKIIKQFQHFVYNYMGGSPEVNQYFFNIPKTLEIKATISEDEPDEASIETKSDTVNEEIKQNAWWETLEDECRPFVMYGDLGHLDHDLKKEAIDAARAEKTAPEHWNEYIFNNVPFSAECPNASKIKDKYLDRIPLEKWECHTQSEDGPNVPDGRRATLRQSLDVRANMGSILKLITATGINPPTKTMLLGARDSMEIASTTKMRERRRQSVMQDNQGLTSGSHSEHHIHNQEMKLAKASKDDAKESNEENLYHSQSLLGSVHHDSLQIIQTHKPDVDHRINYEKVCPVEDCRRMHMDSFIRTLPSYMRANPFEMFNVTLDGYEKCSPEQLELLIERIERKRRRSTEPAFSPCEEWTDIGVTVATQTSEEIDPCECTDELEQTGSGNILYQVDELLPMKQLLDDIQKNCFFDPRIQFNRFKVLGQDSDNSISMEDAQKDFKTARIHEITQILKKHPSLCDLFQSNTYS